MKRLCHSLPQTCSKHRHTEAGERTIGWQIRRETSFTRWRQRELGIYGCYAVSTSEKPTDGLDQENALPLIRLATIGLNRDQRLLDSRESCILFPLPFGAMFVYGSVFVVFVHCRPDCLWASYTRTVGARPCPTIVSSANGTDGRCRIDSLSLQEIEQVGDECIMTS